MSAKRHILSTCLVLYAIAQVLFLIRVEAAGHYICDEKYYVPAARQWLALQDTTNPEHPPLGKQLVAVGIAIWGDRPLGWRFMSTVFGSLTLVGMYLWGLALFRDERAALLTAFTTLGNQLLYVQSRVGMLDVFMFGFAVFGIAAVCRAWDPTMDRRHARRLLLLAGGAFGLATACKWTGAMLWAISAAAVVGVRLMARAGISARPGTEDGWYDPRLFACLTVDDLVSAFVVIPVGVYLATFFPYLFVAHQPRFNVIDLLVMQKHIWDLQRQVVAPTRYASSWPSWPLMLRPLWYYFGWEPDRSAVRCVLYLGNPLVMWGGLLALAACSWSWLRRRSRDAFWIVLVWAALYFSYALLRRKVGYYFYYYPAAMTLSLAWAFVFHRWDAPVRWGEVRVHWRSALFLTATCALCFYFFDLLSGAKEGSEVFRSRMWLRSWY